MKDLIIVLVLAGLLHATRSFRPHLGDLHDDVAGTALAFAFLLLAAFHVGRVLSRLGLPKIVGYLLTGLVAGPSALGLVSPAMIEGLDLVNGVAICLIALTAGAELDVARFRPLLRLIAAMTGWAVLGTCLLLAGAVVALRPMLPFLAGVDGPALFGIAAMLGVTLSAQSPAVVMALLTEQRADGPVSRAALGTVVIADLVVIVLFGVASTLTQMAFGGAADPIHAARAIAWEIFGSLGVGMAVGGLFVLYLRLVGPRQLAVLVLLCCFAVAEIGGRVHLDPLIVMLAAGVTLVNGSRAGARALLHDTDAASLPVFVVFFALAGATLHLDAMAAVGLPAFLIVVVRTLGFRVGGAIATAQVRAEPAVRRWAWAGLLPQAGLALGLAHIVRRTLPDIGEQAAALVLAVIAFNELVMPIVLRYALDASGEAGRRGESADAPAACEDAAPGD